MIFKSLMTSIFILLFDLIDKVNLQCHTNRIINKAIIPSAMASGPFDTRTLPVDVPLGGMWSLTFNWRFIVPAVLPPNPTYLTLLRLETLSPATNLTLYYEVGVRYTGAGWFLRFITDRFDGDPTAFQDFTAANLATAANQKYHQTTISVQNNGLVSDGACVSRFNNQGGIYKLLQGSAEAWDYTSAITMSLFSPALVSTYYFNGEVGRIDFVGGYFSGLATVQNNENTIAYNVPDVLYWLDFTDPQVTQYFANRVNSGFGATINGRDNHTDFQDLHFNLVQGFVIRRSNQMMIFPVFTYRPDMGVNFIYMLKVKFRKVSHWYSNGEDIWLLHHRSNGGGTVFNRAWSNKYDYAANTRIAFNQGSWQNWLCWYAITPTNELGESVESAFQIQSLKAPHFVSQSHFRWSCTLAQPTGISTNGHGGATFANPYFSFGNSNAYTSLAQTCTNPPTGCTAGIIYPNHPQGASTVSHMNILLRELIITEGSAHTSPSFFSPASTCKSNSVLALGFEATDFSVLCPAGYNNYWESTTCILNIPVPGFTDCAHDMNSVGSNCYRCPRYYGHTGLGGCFKCFANCLECVGPNNDQCTSCGPGYGFTGTQCRMCTDDEAWDLSKNLCQLKKARFIDGDYELASFGQLNLMFIPLQGLADLSLYYEYMFDKFWLIDVNRNYEVSRTYTNVPEHRKVSLSFEMMSIDTRHFETFSWAIDKIFVGQAYWNLEDLQFNCTNLSFWGYGYLDMLPTKYYHTIFHSASSMVFDIKSFVGAEWATIWMRELNATFFGCFESCKTCWEDNSPVHCLTCQPGYYFTNFECKACSNTCKTCVNTPFDCTSCPGTQNLLGVTCIAGCGIGYYVDAFGVCFACQPECIQCNGIGNCISCINGYYLLGTVCTPCNLVSCATCITTATTCLSCNAPRLLEVNTCVLSCSASYFQIGVTTCQACPTGCATCDSNQCNTCLPTFRKRGLLCANPCPTGWYILDANNCAQCLSQCLTCADGVSCLTCKPGFVTAACVPCTAPCLTCTGATTTCDSCVPGTNTYLQLGGGSCVIASLCTPGSYAETNNKCMACATQCATCVDFADKCLTCSNPVKIWRNYECIDSCSAGYVAIANLCCPDKCTGCNQLEACSGCIPGYYLTTDFKCLVCDTNCLTCSLNPTRCLSCSPGKFLQNFVCVAACDLNYYLSGTNCLPCHQSCKACTGALNTQCNGCANLFVPYQGLCWPCSTTHPDFLSSRFEEKGGRCWEKCGISGKLSILEVPEGLGGYKACDDGNQINGDGCSSSCTVEKNFICKNGSENTKDVCNTLIKPVAEIIAMYQKGDEFQIQFSKKVSFKSLTSNTVPFPISLEILKLDKSAYNVVWTQPPGTEIEFLNFKIVPQETFRNLKVVVSFERSNIMDQYSNTLMNIKLTVTTSIVVEKRFVLETPYVAINTITKATNIIVPLSSTGITNYVLQSFIRYMTNLQIVGSGMLMNVKTTSYVDFLLRTAAKTTDSTLPSPSYYLKSKLSTEYNAIQVDPRVKFFQRVLQNTASKNESSYSSLFDTSDANYAFKRSGYTNAMIPNLSFSVVVILACAIWYYFASVFLIGKVTVKDGCCKKFLAFNAERALYSSMIFGALELAIFSTNNIFNPKFNHIGEIMSFAASVLTLMVCIALPIILYNISNHNITTLWHPEYYDRYGFLYVEFKLNSKLTKNFFAILVGRLVLYGFAISALNRVPLAQTGMALFIHVVYFGILVKSKPFVSKVMFVIAIIAELFVIMSAACFLITAIDNSHDILKTDARRESLDLANCIAIVMVIITTLIGVILMIVLKIVQCIKKAKSNKKYEQLKKDHPAPLPEESANKAEKQDEKAEKHLMFDDPVPEKEELKPEKKNPISVRQIVEPDDDFLQKQPVPDKLKPDYEAEFLNAEQRIQAEFAEDQF